MVLRATEEACFEGISAVVKGRSIRPVSCAVALTLAFAQYWLLNYAAFPLFDEVFIWTREVSACIGGLALAALACVSYWQPRRVSKGAFTAGVAAFMLLGSIFSALGLVFELKTLTVVGISLATIGGGLANIAVGLGCIGLGARMLGVVVVWAYVASFVLRWVFSLLPIPLNVAIFVIAPMMSVFLVRSTLKDALDSMGRSEAPASFAITTPGSFIPFGHQIFISLVVFRFVYGYTLTFGEIDRVPFVGFLALAPLAILLVLVLAKRDSLSYDGLFRASILFSVAGFLTVSIADGGRGEAANAFLSAGTGFFEILMYYVLISLGSKNPFAALPSLAWGNAMASWGTILGAMAGRTANHAAVSDSHVLATTSAAIVFLLVFYVVVVLRRFSFADTVAHMVRVEGPSIQRAVEEVDLVAARAARLAVECGLTDREREVFDLLAHGRNARFIQDALTVSYNTVKTHVSHVYTKLGVHTQQELIDLVEKR